MNKHIMAATNHANGKSLNDLTKNIIVGFLESALNDDSVADAIREFLPNSPITTMGKIDLDDPTGIKWALSVSGVQAEAAIKQLIKLTEE